jgi:hypothetical protein
LFVTSDRWRVGFCFVRRTRVRFMSGYLTQEFNFGSTTQRSCSQLPKYVSTIRENLIVPRLR